MKTIVVSKSAGSKAGGYPETANSLAICLNFLGFETHIVAPSHESKVVKINNITVHDVKVPRTSTVWVKGSCKRLARYIASQILKPGEKSVLYGIGLWGYTGYLLKKQLKNSMTFFVDVYTEALHELDGLVWGSSWRDYGILNYAKYRLVRELLWDQFYDLQHSIFKACDAILVHYDFTRDTVISRYHWPIRYKITKVPYTLVPLTRKMSNPPEKWKSLLEKENLIVCVSRHDPRKGINLLIRALSMIKNRSWYAAILSDGPFFKKNVGLTKKLGIQDRITFTGFVDSSEPFLRAASVFVLPSLQEGSSSLSLLEAMSYGTPCVATDTCGIPEDITGDVNGLLVRRNPISEIPERLAEAIEKLLDDTNLARRIGQSGMMSYFRQHDETDVIASLRALHQRFGC